MRYEPIYKSFKALNVNLSALVCGFHFTEYMLQGLFS